MKKFIPDPHVRVRKVRIAGKSALILSPEKPLGNAPGILWLHGGGYFMGLKEMVYGCRAQDIVLKYNAVVISPGYTLAWQRPYPAALADCYKALIFLKKNAKALGVRDDQIMVGGESAGGGLCTAVCMLARDRKDVAIAYQMPLYPMISNIDTDSSRHNHGRGWNTFKNHIGWRMYLRGRAKQLVSPYASVIWAEDFSGLPPAYTFVGDGEPFCSETIYYIEKLKKAGVQADMDIYHTNLHAFDLLSPNDPLSKRAVARFDAHFEYALEHFFAEQSDK